MLALSTATVETDGAGAETDGAGGEVAGVRVGAGGSVSAASGSAAARGAVPRDPPLVTAVSAPRARSSFFGTKMAAALAGPSHRVPARARTT
ncbi:hypothetical protein [Actinoplanes ianthinogenes]|uniref:hypothetical protein n=1 Tax=Actinoplanes ianthinogenes TaxID=122358 RepID=UPI0016718384|nr:hypothetical protein [Actinoplanes ianthinogenes]